MTRQVSVNNRVRHGVVRLAVDSEQGADRREGDAEVESLNREDRVQRRKRVPLGIDHAANTVFGLVGEETIGKNESHQEAPSQRFLDTVDEPSHSKYRSGITSFELEGEIVASLHIRNLKLRNFESIGVEELAAAARGQDYLLRAALRRI